MGKNVNKRGKSSHGKNTDRSKYWKHGKSSGKYK